MIDREIKENETKQLIVISKEYSKCVTPKIGWAEGTIGLGKLIFC